MSDGNDGNDEFTILDLINYPVVANTDAVGHPAFDFFTTRWLEILFQLYHFIFDAGNGIGQFIGCSSRRCFFQLKKKIDYFEVSEVL